MKNIGLAFLAALLLWGAGGCGVEFCGQRVALHYEEESDTLQALVFYDGVFCGKPAVEESDLREVREFLARGEVALLHPLFQVRTSVPGALLERARNQADAADPAVVLARLLQERFATRALGTYRLPGGALGAAQLVTIRGLGELFAAANLFLDRYLAAPPPAGARPADGWARSRQLWQAAAAAGHRWLARDGRTLVFDLPLHLPEWRRAKAGLLLRLAGRELADEDRLTVVQVLASAPFVLLEEPDRLLLRLDLREPAPTLRFWQDAKAGHYRPDLAETLVREIPDRLEELLARELVGGAGEPLAPEAQAAARAVLDWGPPEERVRALLAAAAQPRDAGQRARELLAEFAARWNEAGGLPSAPAEAGDLAAWGEWLDRIRRFPLPEPPAPAAPASPAPLPAPAPEPEEL